MRIRLLSVCFFTILVGITTCVNWLFNIDFLSATLLVLNGIKFNCALLFVLCGVALYLLVKNEKKAFQIISILIFTLGFLTLLEDLLNFNLGIDELFVKDREMRLNDTLRYGRMALGSSICFSLLGLSFFMSLSQNKTLANASYIILYFVILISAITLIGHLFDVPVLYKWFLKSGTPVLSSLLFFALSVSLFYINKNNIVPMFTGNRIGNVMTKRLLLPLLFGIVSIGFITSWLYSHDYISANFAIALCTIVFSLIAVFLIWITSKKLNLIERKRKHVERIVLSLNNELEEKVEQRTAQWKKAFIELRDQKELFFALFHKGPIAKVLANLKTGVMVDCSDAYLKLFGFSRQDVIGKTALESGITEDTGLRNRIISQIKDHGSALIEDYQLRKKNGEYVWVSAYLSMMNINGEDHLLSTMIDVTDRKKIENNYKYILQNATDIIYTTDKNGNFEFLNESVTLSTGYTPEELIGKHFTAIIHPDFKREAKLFYLRQYRGNVEQTYFEFKITDKNGAIKWIGQNVKIKRDFQNNYEGFLAVSRDVTERKNLEIDLQLKNERLEEAMRIAKFGYFEHEVSTHKITRSSELYEIFETADDPSRLDKEPYHTFIVPEYLDAFKKHFEKITILKQQSSIEYQIRTLKGNLRYISTYARPIFDKAGNVVLIKGTTHDVTARKEIEVELRKAKELSEQSVKLKDRFLANMTHEIRTPMNAILGFSGILDESPLNPKQKEWIKIIISSGENLLVILNDLLDFSKIEAGMIQIESIPVDLNKQLQSLVALSEIKAKEKKLELKLIIENELPELVCSDPVRLQQIFLNLVSNAIKFTEKGFVKVDAKVLSETETDALIQFKVSDSGIGISPEQSTFIFERFTQASSETTRTYGGTGLGLSIVKELVQLLNGKIELKSNFGKGSEFILSLPFKKCLPAEIQSYKKLSQKNVLNDSLRLDELNILLVEDNRINQQFAISLMDDLGFKTVIANNGKEAIDKLNETHFDLILMDLQMPVMDGQQATFIIRNTLKNDIPIIALTANAFRDEKQRCINLGMNDYITKPIIPEELYTKIKNQLPHKLLGIYEDRKSETVTKTDWVKSFDIAELTAKLNGDKEALKDLITVFLEDSPKDINKLENAIRAKDYKSIEQLSHKLVSSFSIMCADNSANILRKVENAAENKDSINQIKELLKEFSADFIALKNDLKVAGY